MEHYPQDDVFDCLASQFLGVTFSDVILETNYSECLPHQTSLESRFSRTVPLHRPIVSSAMDTVTESKMAIAMAEGGGLGIIHRSLSAKDQASEVDRVKHRLNAMVEKPICVHDTDSIESIIKMCDENPHYQFRSFPVVDQNQKLVGVLTGNDLGFYTNEPSVSAATAMTRDVVTAQQGTTLDQAWDLMKKHKCKLLPIVTPAREVISLYAFADVQRIKFDRLPVANLDDRGQLRVGAAIGSGEEALKRAELLVAKRVDVLVLDTAHSNTADVVTSLKQLKKIFPATDVVVGNISTVDAVERLIQAGADGVKVGQGPGSICTTQDVGGTGCPQLTAVHRCARAARDTDVPVCADGGIRFSGDAVKALAAGASSVMLGNMLAGTAEAPGDVIHYKGRQWKIYRGMGSLGAMRESHAARERYRQTSKTSVLVPEGISARVPYKGEVCQLLPQYAAQLQVGLGYVGAANLKELQQKARFIRRTTAGETESHPHDVDVTEESPT